MDYFSSNAWYRIRDTAPRLSPRVRVGRQTYRNEVWLVIHDRVTGKFHRCMPILSEVLSLMDGERSVEQIWRILLDRHADSAITQEDMVQFLADLGKADLLVSSSRADLAEQQARRYESVLAKIKQFVGNPVSLRIPLVNPNNFLDQAYRFTRWIPFPFVFAAWTAAVVIGLMLTATNWTLLAQNFTDQAFAWDNLLLVWLVFPLVKALHEIGHGLATKRRGGAVHEAGIMLLLFVPIPYIECSSASAFPRKRDRVLVGSAGMMVDLFVGAIALFVWVELEPGLLRSLLFSVVLVSWASTLLFNGNPLLRYDGYFVLSDLLEIPNLAQRSTRLYGYLFQRFIAGLPDTSPPHGTAQEGRWLLAYGLLSYLYRIAIALLISITLVGEFEPVGTLLALWVMLLMVFLPIGKQLIFLLTSPRLSHHRLRAVTLAGAIVGLAGLAAGTVPVTRSVVVLGEVAAKDAALLRAEHTGMILKRFVSSGEEVTVNQVVLELGNDELTSRNLELSAKAALSEGRVRAALIQQDSVAVGHREQFKALGEELTVSKEDLAKLQVTARQSGIVQFHRDDAGLGQFVERGEVLGTVQGTRDRIVRVALAQDLYAEFNKRIYRAEGFWPSANPLPFSLLIQSVSAGASAEIPGPVHSREGGGLIATDPRDSRHITALFKVFVIDLEFDDGEAKLPAIGSRIWVKFEHEPNSLAQLVSNWLGRHFLFR